MKVNLTQLYQALQVHPKDTRLWQIAANAMIQAKDLDRAFNTLDALQTIDHENPEPVYQMGVILDRQGHYERAGYWLRKARDRHRQYRKHQTGATVIWEKMGNAYARLGRLEHAERCYNHALGADDTDPAALFAKSQILLAREQWAEGWALYESRWDIPEMVRMQVEGHKTDLKTLPPRWDGVSAGRVLIYAEQGTGDVIQMTRYFFSVEMASGLRPVVICQPELVPLLKSWGYWAFPNGTTETERCDYSVPALSLPYLRRAWQPLGARIPHRRERNSGPSRVGVCWKGSPDHANDKDRSCPESLLPYVASIPNVEAISLQHGPEGRYFRDFADTAEVVQGLDCVVTVDTAIAHLAGTLGVPTYLIPPTVPDWRWPGQGSRTCWYDSVQITRRKVSREWGPAIQDVVQKITQQAEAT